MSIPGSALPLLLASPAGAAAGYEIERSLRFSSGDSSFLSRTPASAGNRKTWTWAGWVKFAGASSSGYLFGNYTDGSNYSGLNITASSSGLLRFYDFISGVRNASITWAPAYRDFSAWYHLVLVVDSTQATESDRIKLYINGSVVSTTTAYYPALNADLRSNQSIQHNIGALQNTPGSLFNGYLADVHFIDGQALDPTDFGEFDDNGVWQPIEYAASGPNNGATWSSNPTNFTNPGNAFSGSSSDYAEVSSSGAKGTFTFPSSIQVQNNVTFAYSSGTSGNLFVNNSSTAMQGTSLQVQTISFTGALTDISLQSASQPVLYYFAVDGVPLIDGDSTNVGTNGFHLPFSDNSSASALGTDDSGNGNDWTVNNISGPSSPSGYTADYAISGTAPTYATYASGIDGSWPALFNGNTSTGVFAYSAAGYSELDVQNKPTWSSQIRFYVQVYYGGTVYINGVDCNVTSAGWKDVTSIVGSSGTLDTIRVTNLAGNYYQRLAAIELDGTVLNDGGAVFIGSAIDSLLDSPTNGDTADDTGLGGEVAGNYCVWNPLDAYSVTASNGNLDAAGTGIDWNAIRGTQAMSSGKWYFEVTKTNTNLMMVGVSAQPFALPYLYQSPKAYLYYSTGQKYNNNSSSSYGSSYASGDVIGIALDVDAGKIWFSKNGTWQASGDPATGTNPAYSSISSDNYLPACLLYTTSSSCTLNTGARPFAYSAPSGFQPIATPFLDTPTIEDGSTAMDVVTYSGNSSTQTISGLEFSPDLVWIKARSANFNHSLSDTVRGPLKTLASDGAFSEYSETAGLNSFTSDGWTFNGDGYYSVNLNGYTYVGWAWDAGSSTVSNTDGSISSSVRANASAGFSIVSWTADGSNAGSIGHGLNIRPSVVLYKQRSTGSWYWWTNAIDGTEDYLVLNSTGGKGDIAATYGAPTSTTFSNFGFGTGNDMIAYCWAPVESYSSFGSYQGNGSSDGPFVYTGFRIKFLMIKIYSGTTSNWVMLDSTRDPDNVVQNNLYADTSDAENQFDWADFLSNGFKLRVSYSQVNGSGYNYLYCAFAENPFRSARAR